MKKPAKNNECIASHSIWGKISFGERLGQFCRDLQDDPHWKYEQLSPVQLLAEMGINKYSTDDSELSRANWFWSRRPRLLPAVSWIFWLIVALGLPFWLVIVPLIGVPILIIATVIVDIDIVRSVRWRRQYESSIDRLIRTATNSTDTFSADVFL